MSSEVAGPKSVPPLDAAAAFEEMRAQQQADDQLSTADLLALPDHRTVSTLWLRAARKRGATISHAERNIVLVMNLHAEVDNGGFDQFFFNSSGDDAKDTAAALREVGLHELVKTYEQALAAFPGVPSPDIATRRGQMTNIPSETRALWRGLEDRFYADKGRSDRCDAALAVYVRAHAADL